MHWPQSGGRARYLWRWPMPIAAGHSGAPKEGLESLLAAAAIRIPPSGQEAGSRECEMWRLGLSYSLCPAACSEHSEAKKNARRLYLVLTLNSRPVYLQVATTTTTTTTLNKDISRIRISGTAEQRISQGHALSMLVGRNCLWFECAQQSR